MQQLKTSEVKFIGYYGTALHVWPTQDEIELYEASETKMSLTSLIYRVHVKRAMFCYTFI